jgi:hypothetical protein
MRPTDYESGTLTASAVSTDKVQQRSTMIETGSLSTLDFPSAILHAEESRLFQTAQLDCKVRLLTFCIFCNLLENYSFRLIQMIEVFLMNLL